MLEVGKVPSGKTPPSPPPSFPSADYATLNRLRTDVLFQLKEKYPSGRWFNSKIVQNERLIKMNLKGTAKG